MAKKLTKAQLSAKLVEIVNATNAGQVVYTPAEVHGPLVTDGLAEVNATMTNENGIATRATAKGIETVNASASQGQSAPAASTAKPTFQLEKASLPPISGRGRAGTELYPFDQMEVGDSFFVPNDASKENAAKSLASTVSSATKRYAEVIPGEFKTITVKGKDGAPDSTKQVPALKETRKFVVRSRTAAAEAAEGFAHGNDGARVYRVA